MKNFLQENKYLILACLLMFVSQWYNATTVKSQPVDLEEEYSFCANAVDAIAQILLAIPPNPEPIIIIAGFEKIYNVGPPQNPPYYFDDTPPFYFQPYYVDYDCPNYDTIIVTPNIDWVRYGLTVILKPKETTEYTITYKVTNDPHCDNVYTSKIKVEVFQTCSFNKNDIQDIQAEYPWVSSLENVCLNSIDVYEKNNTNYLMFNHPNFKSLYYQDGSYLCLDAPDYSCLEAYQLTNKIKTYTCNQPLIENPIEETPTTFNSYNWLSNFINPNACNGESVYVYDADTYEFLIVKTNLGESIYKTNGELICFSPTGGFSFIGLYNESRILDSWHCEQGFQGRESKPTLQDQAIQIFPNPAKDNLFINLQQLTFEQPVISIYDVQGKQVKQLASTDAFAGIVQMNVGDLERGIYLVEVRISDLIHTEKLIAR